MLIVGSGTIKCQHCGHVIKIASKDSVKTYSTNTQESKTNIKHKPKTSILSILSLIFSILVITFWLGIILSIIDLCKPNRKKGCSVISLLISILWFGIIVAVGQTPSESDTNESISKQDVKEYGDNKEKDEEYNIRSELNYEQTIMNNQTNEEYSKDESDLIPEINDSSEGVVGIEPEYKSDPIEMFGYHISGDKVYLESYIGKSKVLEIKPSYSVNGLTYWTDISEFMIGIGNNTVKTVIFDEGFTELRGSIFNSTSIENVFLPRSMTKIYDNTISYLHPKEQSHVKIYYAETEKEWKQIFTQYQRTRVEDAEFGEELGIAIADKINEMIGSGYDSSEYEYFFSTSPDDLR